jgi:hypothetical protein
MVAFSGGWKVMKSFVEMETELQFDDNFIAQLNYPSHLIRFLPLLI